MCNRRLSSAFALVEPALCLHQLHTTSGDQFPPHSAMLTDARRHFRVGRSGALVKTTMAEDVYALARSLGASDKLTIVGHNIGMMVAYAQAARHPAQTSRLKRFYPSCRLTYHEEPGRQSCQIASLPKMGRVFTTRTGAKGKRSCSATAGRSAPTHSRTRCFSLIHFG